jgi:hypothetical protein
VNKAEWILTIAFAASVYSVGTIWMTQMGYRLWPYVAPGDFGAYHGAWWADIKPIVFPLASIAFFGCIAMIWWRPEGVKPGVLWFSIGSQVATYVLTAALWGRWQAQTHFARLTDGSLDPMYARIMNTHWIRAALITVNGLAMFWMMIEHLSSRIHSPVP